VANYCLLFGSCCDIGAGYLTPETHSKDEAGLSSSFRPAGPRGIKNKQQKISLSF
jgi:hypothetical protein